MKNPDFSTKRVTTSEPHLMDQMLDVFADAFEDAAAYSGKRPSRDYTKRLLQTESFVALAALHGTRVIGAMTAYELVKFEQERSEFYIYDLAVDAGYRRIGVATALIMALKPIAAVRGARIAFIQADQGDVAPIALYSKLGTREDVLHFDIEV